MKKLSLLFVLFVLFGLTAMTNPAMANLVINGGFETGDSTGWDWFPQGDQTAVVGEDVYEGDYACKLGDMSSGVFPQLISAWLPAGNFAGTTQTFSFMAKNIGMNDIQLRYKLYAYDAAGEGVGPHAGTAWAGHIAESWSGVITPTQGYVAVSYDFAIPADAAYVQVKEIGLFNGDATNYSGLAMIDNVVITPEPATMALLSLGSLLVIRRKKQTR